MKYIVPILIIFVLVCFFIFSIGSLGDSSYGSAPLIMIGISGFALYKIGKLIYEGYKGGESKSGDTPNNGVSAQNSKSLIHPSYQHFAGSFSGNDTSDDGKEDDAFFELMMMKDTTDNWDKDK